MDGGDRRCQRASALYGTYLGEVDFSAFPGTRPGDIAVSPDGSELLVDDGMNSRVLFVDIVPGSPTENMAVASAALVGGVAEMMFHPGGEYAYCISGAFDAVYVIDMNPASPTHREVVEGDTLTTYEPVSIAFSPMARWHTSLPGILRPAIPTSSRTTPGIHAIRSSKRRPSREPPRAFRRGASASA